MFLLLALASALGQTSTPTPSPELKKWDVWIGDWTLSGTAKDAPAGPEYKVDWHLHERWVLGGFFVQVDQTWKGNGQELHVQEMLSYDPARKVHTVSGFASDGSTWSLTATFDGTKVIEQGASKGPDGVVTTCHTTWVFSAGGKALSGTQECEQGGVRWTSMRVQGTKSATGH
jgi:hypothetical protein